MFRKINRKLKSILIPKMKEYVERYEKEKILYAASKLANKYLKGKRGIEIGGSFHNQFGLNTLNVDFTEESTIFTEMQEKFSKNVLKVDRSEERRVGKE